MIENAKETLEGFQSKDGPVQGMTASVKQTMDDARAAMAGFSENMDALKHNFLLRGYFKGRGYFDLAQISPADYRLGVLTKGSDRRLVRVWRHADALFEAEPDHPESERLTDPGKARVDSAIAPYLEQVASGMVIVEGYAQQGAPDEQYLRSRARASLVRDYLDRQVLSRSAGDRRDAAQRRLDRQPGKGWFRRRGPRGHPSEGQAPAAQVTAAERSTGTGP